MLPSATGPAFAAVERGEHVLGLTCMPSMSLRVCRRKSRRPPAGSTESPAGRRLPHLAFDEGVAHDADAVRVGDRDGPLEQPDSAIHRPVISPLPLRACEPAKTDPRFAALAAGSP